MAVYNQVIVSPGAVYLDDGIYTAQDDRRHLKESGGVGIATYPTGYGVTAVSGMSVTIDQGTAYILAGNVTDGGSFRVRSSASRQVTVPNAHATLPRLDQIVLRVMDDASDGSGFSEARIEVVPGTATAGATFANRNGAASLNALGEISDSLMLLADVLVPAAAGSLVLGDTKDRRIPMHNNSEMPGLSIAEMRVLVDATKAGYVILPHDGIEVAVRADPTNEVWWRFRNVGLSTPLVWSYLGGAPMFAEILTSQTTTNVAYVDLTTAGPSITVPFAGWYEITFGCDIKSDVADVVTKVAVKLGAAATADAESADGRGVASKYVQRTIIRQLAQDDIVKMQYKSNGGGVLTADNRNLSVRPIRLI
jgi:hypothetical protein